MDTIFVIRTDNAELINNITALMIASNMELDAEQESLYYLPDALDSNDVAIYFEKDEE